jgi:catechol 2,3-dioxygenase
MSETAPAAATDALQPKVHEPHVHELGHLVLYVSDLARSVEFYEHVLGWRKLPQPVGMPAAAFSGGRTHHELLLIEVGPGATPIPPGRRVGLYHFGLKVGDTDDELRAMLARVRERPDLVRLVGATNHHVTHSLYVTDPDGNEIELYIDVPGADWRGDPSLLLKPGEPLSL